MAAALTKRIPALFAPLGIMTEPTKRSVLIGILVSAGIVAIVGIGQHLGPLAMLRESLSPASVSLAQIAPGGVREVAGGEATNILAQPFAYPAQFLGLSNALARLFARPANDWTLPFFQGFYYVVTAGVVTFATYLAYAVLHGRHRIPRPQAEILSFAVFFAMTPLASITTHPHTFIFLLPTWTAIVALVQVEPLVWRKYGLGALAAVCYLFAGFPAPATVADRILHTHLGMSPAFQDPIWANLVLLLVLFAYGTLRLHDQAPIHDEAKPRAQSAETEIATAPAGD